MSWSIKTQHFVTAATRVSHTTMSPRCLYICVSNTPEEEEEGERGDGGWRIEKYDLASGEFLGFVPVFCKSGLARMEYHAKSDVLFCLHGTRDEFFVVPCDDSDDWSPSTLVSRDSFANEDIVDASLAADGTHIYALLRQRPDPDAEKQEPGVPMVMVLRHSWRHDDPVQLSVWPTELPIDRKRAWAIHANPTVPESFAVLLDGAVAIFAFVPPKDGAGVEFARQRIVSFASRAFDMSTTRFRWSRDGSQFLLVEPPNAHVAAVSGIKASSGTTTLTKQDAWFAMQHLEPLPNSTWKFAATVAERGLLRQLELVGESAMWTRLSTGGSTGDVFGGKLGNLSIHMPLQTSTFAAVVNMVPAESHTPWLLAILHSGATSSSSSSASLVPPGTRRLVFEPLPARDPQEKYYDLL